MNEELRAFMEEIEAVEDAALLRQMLYVMKKDLLETEARESERIKAGKELHLLYQQVKDERDGLRKENAALKERIAHEEGKNALNTNALFGRQTEKLSDLTDGTGDAGSKDPLDEDAVPDDEAAEEKDTIAEKKPRKHGKRNVGKHARDLSKLPHIHRYEYDPEELDRLFGKGNWRIASWHDTVKKSYIPAIIYAEHIHTPVLSVGLEHSMVCLTPKGILLPGSDATSALVAAVMNNKFSLSLPLNRLEGELGRFDTVLSRQTMDNWVIRFSRDLFFKVYEWMGKLLKKSGCTQCDETTLLVIRDGRKAGRKSFMWVHITSELAECEPVAVFSYEPDRSAEHLRGFYDDYVGKIICDAYCAYHTFEEEQGGAVIICGCWMHSRRRWAESLRLRNVKGLAHEQIDLLPEVRALRLIGEIYRADQELKGLSPSARLNGRQDKVAAKVLAYFEFISAFDMNDPSIPEKMRDAICYSLNQRAYLERFLEDGTVPIDNGACERRIRPLAVGRQNWLFCNSEKGAEASAILYSLVETAKMNGANVFYYLKYLLENAPSRSMPDLSSRAMNELMPWSKTYKAYEAQQKQAYLELVVGRSEEEPTGKSLMKCSA